MKTYEIIIIGCGASGIMCALTCKDKKVAIIDSNLKPAKKVLATGNGRCNLTNVNLTSENYNKNIDKYLNLFNVEKTLNLFNLLGLEIFSDEEGRVYPISNSSKSVVDVLVNSLDKNTQLFLGQTVIDIEKIDGSFVVKTDKEVFSCKKLVVASGGNSLLNVLEKLNIKHNPFVPSLVALKSDNIKDLNGIKLSGVKVTVTNFLGKSKSEKGEVLFKDSGLSGIVIFNLSSLFSRVQNFKGKAVIDLLPNLTKEQLTEKLEKRKNLNVAVDKFFVGFFQNAIANEIFKQCKINTNINSKDLTKEQILKIADVIKNLQFNIVGSYDNNQIYSGGVELESLTNSLMSKQIDNLYFCGEVCNVDGVCGGYNLQWAWTSGHIVGESL